MKTVVIAGASGVVGARALQHALMDGDVVRRVVAVGRRPLDVRDERLECRIADFADASSLAAALPDDVDVALCCLGTTMKQAGSKAAFRAVDFDAVLAFGAAARHKGAQRFVLVSSLGADARSASFYLKTKGEVEAALARLGYPQLTILRPSFIDDEGARRDDRLGERLGLPVARAVFRVLGPQRRYAPVTATSIGRAMVRLAFDDATEPVRVVHSERIHALGD